MALATSLRPKQMAPPSSPPSIQAATKLRVGQIKVEEATVRQITLCVCVCVCSSEKSPFWRQAM